MRSTLGVAEYTRINKRLMQSPNTDLRSSIDLIHLSIFNHTERMTDKDTFRTTSYKMFSASFTVQ